MSSAIEVPAEDQDFYQAKDVPHGEVREHWYCSKIRQRVAGLLCLYAAGLRRKHQQPGIRCSICSMAMAKISVGGRTRVA